LVSSGAVAILFGMLGPVLCACADGQPAGPDVLNYNLRVGSQAFGACYQFTSNSVVVEQAEQLVRMGSDIVKFSLSPSSPDSEGQSLVSRARDSADHARLFDMPFRHYFMWVSAPTKPKGYWKKGANQELDRQEYEEVHALTRYLLTRYEGTGKTFYLGNWEGDWLLLGTGQHGTNNPPPEAVLGMRSWLNARQQAVDDAKRVTPHKDVDVFFYVEVNRVRDAMRDKPDSNVRLVNAVLPHVAAIDYVSYSSYDAQNLSEPELVKTLDYIVAHTPTNKAAAIPGRRLFIGEYGFGGGKRTPEQQGEPTRAYIARLLRWGSPFILFWQVYNNEKGNFFCLIDAQGKETPCYDLHRRFLAASRVRVAEFKQRTGRLPTDDEFTKLALPLVEPAASPAVKP
jgi:hypothetical protein